jgi:hypothetical protein
MHKLSIPCSIVEIAAEAAQGRKVSRFGLGSRLPAPRARRE